MSASSNPSSFQPRMRNEFRKLETGYATHSVPTLKRYQIHLDWATNSPECNWIREGWTVERIAHFFEFTLISSVISLCSRRSRTAIIPKMYDSNLELFCRRKKKCTHALGSLAQANYGNYFLIYVRNERREKWTWFWSLHAIHGQKLFGAAMRASRSYIFEKNLVSIL